MVQVSSLLIFLLAGVMFLQERDSEGVLRDEVPDTQMDRGVSRSLCQTERFDSELNLKRPANPLVRVSG